MQMVSFNERYERKLLRFPTKNNQKFVDRRKVYIQGEKERSTGEINRVRGRERKRGVGGEKMGFKIPDELL